MAVYNFRDYNLETDFVTEIFKDSKLRTSIFSGKRVPIFECKLNKDLCLFTQEEVKDAIESWSMFYVKSTVYNQIYVMKKYREFMGSHGFPTSDDEWNTEEILSDCIFGANLIVTQKEFEKIYTDYKAEYPVAMLIWLLVFNHAPSLTELTQLNIDNIDPISKKWNTGSRTIDLAEIMFKCKMKNIDFLYGDSLEQINICANEHIDKWDTKNGYVLPTAENNGGYIIRQSVRGRIPCEPLNETQISGIISNFANKKLENSISYTDLVYSHLFFQHKKLGKPIDVLLRDPRYKDISVNFDKKYVEEVFAPYLYMED